MARLIDPLIARPVARRIAGDGRVGDSYLMERLTRDLERSVPLAESLVAEKSGIPAPAAVRWGIIGRAEWADRNIDAMAELVRPLAERIEIRLERLPWPLRLAQRTVVSTEVGILLGYVSRRVLGQYDLLVPDDETPDAPARSADGAPLYFVGVNMVETERRASFVPEDFALWVALHEVTHRFQFAGVPWLKGRFLELVSAYLGSVEIDASGLAARLAGAARRLASRSLPPEEKSPVYLLATEEQRRALDDIQALMAVVEGHGNYVMDSIGARVIPSMRRMRYVFDRRRSQLGAVQRAINHVLGLEMKLRQYELGKRFCDEVVATGGESALARLWDGPESFPALAELREPNLWLRRVA